MTRRSQKYVKAEMYAVILLFIYMYPPFDQDELVTSDLLLLLMTPLALVVTDKV